MVRDYLRTIFLIRVAMVIALITIFLWPLFFPLTEEQQDSMGTGGGLFCGTLWMGLIVTFSALCLWMFLRRSHEAAISLTIVSWLLPFGLHMLGSSYVYIVASSLAPMVLTVLTLRLDKLVRKVGQIRQPMSPTGGQDQPILRVYR
jgi:hypothetical protein